MPVAIRQDQEMEDGHGLRIEAVPTCPKLNLEQFKEIRELLEKLQTLQDEERESRRSIEKLAKAIEQAQEQVEKAEIKKETLKKHIDLLRVVNDGMVKKMEDEKEYHKRHAAVLGAKEVADNHYEIIYEKCAVGLRYEDQHLRVVSQDPEVFNEEQLNHLNEKLKAQCTNYGSAIVLVGKTLKHLSL